MKSNYLTDEQDKADFFMLASQIYVRLRRVSSRVIDAVYMVENEDYAREIIRIATLVNDMELHQLAGRMQQIMAGVSAVAQPVAPVIPTLRQPAAASVAPAAAMRKPVAVVPAAPEVAVTQMDVAVNPDHVPEEVSHHYIGALR